MSPLASAWGVGGCASLNPTPKPLSTELYTPNRWGCSECFSWPPLRPWGTAPRRGMLLLATSTVQTSPTIRPPVLPNTSTVSANRTSPHPPASTAKDFTPRLPQAALSSKDVMLPQLDCSCPTWPHSADLATRARTHARTRARTHTHTQCRPYRLHYRPHLAARCECIRPLPRVV